MSDTVSKNLGVITAYGMATQGGYIGTKQNFYQVLSEITNGLKIVPIYDITQPIVPKQWTGYSYTLVGDEVITFATPVQGYAPTFELWLTQPLTPVSFTFGNTITWCVNNVFDSSNPAPSMVQANTQYVLTFRWSGSKWLGNLAYIVQ